jgi:DNA-directed RNA polymerase subunit beta
MTKTPIQHSARGLELVFLSIELREPIHTGDHCRQLGLTYACPLYVRTRLLIRETGEIKEQDIYLADIPMITPGGTFIIDGVERALTIDWINNRSLNNSPLNRSLDTLKSTAIKRMSKISFETVTPSRLIDIRPLGTAITEFFVGSREVGQ